MLPLVDENDNRAFHWTPVNFDALNDYLWDQLGWTSNTLRAHTHDALSIWDAFVRGPIQQYQTRVTAFVRKMPRHIGGGGDSSNDANAAAACDKLFAPKSRVGRSLYRLKRRRRG